jgi:hypothetical protein
MPASPPRNAISRAAPRRSDAGTLSRAEICGSRGMIVAARAWTDVIMRNGRDFRISQQSSVAAGLMNAQLGGFAWCVSRQPGGSIAMRAGAP